MSEHRRFGTGRRQNREDVVAFQVEAVRTTVGAGPAPSPIDQETGVMGR
jgi:hypothetical protein